MISRVFEELWREKWRRGSKTVVGDAVRCCGGMLLESERSTLGKGEHLFEDLWREKWRRCGKTVAGDVVGDVVGFVGGMLCEWERRGLGSLPAARPPARRKNYITKPLWEFA